MVHSAYDSFELLRNCPVKIDAVASSGSKLFLGCSDGSLRIYGPDLTATSDFLVPQPEFLRKQPYIFERSVINFSRKPLLFIKILVSRELILSLSESIAFHRLPNFETLAVITKAKGANACCWDDSRGFLCFARQKRVHIFRHDGGRGFVEVKEFGVPDTVKSMAWCGENICLGIRKEYMILNCMNGALTEIFPSGRVAPPLVVSLPSGELLLSKENIGVFVDHNGKLLQTERICWSEAPSIVIVQTPYAIGLLPRRVEIRYLRVPYPLIQTIVLQNVRTLSHSNNVVIVGLDNIVFGLFPVPIGAQIVQLTASGDFEEALAMCKMLPPEDANLRSAKETSIHIRYAHYLFDNGNYEDAMEHFIQSQVGIPYVLSLYPSITLQESSLISEPGRQIETTQNYPTLSRASSELSDDLDSFSQLPSPESEESTALETKKMNHNTLMALIKFLQKKRFSIIDKATSEGTVNVILDAADIYSRRNSSSFKKPDKENDVISSSARELAAILDTSLLQALLFTGQNEAAVELLKGHNFCDLNICEEILQKSNQYTALLELYKSHSLHRKALKLLHRLVKDPPDGHSQYFTPTSILYYLKPLCATDPILVLDFSIYALETCPTQTVELFLSGNIPADLVNSYLKRHAPSMQGRYLELMLEMNENSMSGNLQSEMVLIYLSEVLEWYTDLSTQHKWEETEYSPTRKKLLHSLHAFSGYNPDTLLKRLPIDALYEERAILLGKMKQHSLALSIYVHKLNLQELALSYCDRVFESGSSGNIYLTLLQIYLNPKKSSKDVEKQIAYSASSPVVSILKSSLPATGRSRGRGTKKIAAIEGAEDVRIMSAKSSTDQSDANGGEISEENNIMLDRIVDLLSKRWDRINGAQALKLLPRETKLQNLVPFLGPLLRKSCESRRNLSVIKSLRESERLQVKEEVNKQRKNMVRINGESMCAICNKKVGTSVFAVYPNGNTLVHFVCFKDSQRIKFSS